MKWRQKRESTADSSISIRFAGINRLRCGYMMTSRFFSSTAFVFSMLATPLFWFYDFSGTVNLKKI